MREGINPSPYTGNPELSNIASKKDADVDNSVGQKKLSTTKARKYNEKKGKPGEAGETIPPSSSRTECRSLPASCQAQQSRDKKAGVKRRSIRIDAIAPPSPGAPEIKRRRDKKMSETENKLLWAGVDWGDSRHAVCVVDKNGDVATAFTVESNPDGLDEMIAGICAFGTPAGVAIETPRGMVVHKLLQAGLTVFPINPKVSKAWRDGIKAASPKTDPADAFCLADGLRHHCKNLRSIVLDDPIKNVARRYRQKRSSVSQITSHSCTVI